MQYSLYLIKSEATEYRDAISSLIGQHKGLQLLGHKTVILTNSMVRQIFPTLSGQALRLTCCHLDGEECEVGWVSGENAVTDLAALVGQDPEPTRNDPDTLRYRFGIKNSHVGIPLNAVDAPSTVVEASRLLRLFECL